MALTNFPNLDPQPVLFHGKFESIRNEAIKADKHTTTNKKIFIVSLILGQNVENLPAIPWKYNDKAYFDAMGDTPIMKRVSCSSKGVFEIEKIYIKIVKEKRLYTIGVDWKNAVLVIKITQSIERRPFTYHHHLLNESNKPHLFQIMELARVNPQSVASVYENPEMQAARETLFNPFHFPEDIINLPGNIVRLISGYLLEFYERPKAIKLNENPRPDGGIDVFQDWQIVAKLKDCAREALATIFTARTDAALLDSRVEIIRENLAFPSTRIRKPEIAAEGEKFLQEYAVFLRNNDDASVTWTEISIPKNLRRLTNGALIEDKLDRNIRVPNNTGSEIAMGLITQYITPI